MLPLWFAAPPPPLFIRMFSGWITVGLNQFEFVNSDLSTVSLDVYDDEFTDGNQIFAFYSNEDLKTGSKLIIQNHGISQRFYEYMTILLQQSKDDSGGPFETQPATLRGNCINETNPSNYPLGYFRASEVSGYTYTVE